jgi:hypothetical protein
VVMVLQFVRKKAAPSSGRVLQNDRRLMVMVVVYIPCQP